MAATPPLRVWTLSSKTPKELYDSTLCSEGGSNHYTVSGASGSNLAFELKQNLSRGVLAGKADLAAVVDVSPSRSDDEDDVAEGGFDTPPKGPAAAGSHFTVSGASGTKLASELKQNLSRSALASSRAELAAAGEDEVLPELRKQIEPKDL